MRLLIVAIFMIIFLYADDDYNEGYHIPKDFSFLDLSKDQKDALKKIVKEQRDMLKKLHRKEERLEDELKEIFVKEDSFDKDSFIKKSMALKSDMVTIEAEFFAKVHSILNKKQRKRFIKYIEEWEVE